MRKKGKASNRSSITRINSTKSFAKRLLSGEITGLKESAESSLRFRPSSSRSSARVVKSPTRQTVQDIIDSVSDKEDNNEKEKKEEVKLETDISV